MIYEVYQNKQVQVEAAQFVNEEGDIAEIVQNLVDSGVKFINVNIIANFPNQEETDYTTAITFIQNGVSQTLFEGDFLVFDEDDNATVWNEVAFHEEFELPEE